MDSNVREVFLWVNSDRKIVPLLRDLGLKGWRIVYSDDPWCNSATKTLYVRIHDHQCLIHEAAHALIGGGHRRHFWNLLETMIDYYLAEPLNAHQQKMRSDYLNA
jgi:hypothetical protein